jgi:hypothetical protein
MLTHFRNSLEGDRITELPATAAAVMTRMTIAGNYGPGVAAPTGGEGPVHIGWNVSVPQGRYALWAHYAAIKPTPARLSVNGQERFAHALRDTTFGAKVGHQTWVFQGLVELRDGRNDIELTGHESLPYLRALALVPDDGRNPADVDCRTPTAKPVAEPVAGTMLAGLVRAATPLVRPLIARGCAVEEIAAVMAQLAQAIRVDLDDPQARLGFRGPLNGQIIRQSIFTAMDRLLRFDVFLETGAYLGTTTEMLATFERPVYSCESKPEFYYRAAPRLAPFANAHLTLQDSRSFLRDLFAGSAASFSMPFCYLDAHWYDDLPLPEEIELIRGRYERFAIMVDDFKHPAFDYPFDRYASGIELTLEYLLPRLGSTRGLSFLFPMHPQHLETGPRRGTLVIAPDAVAETLLAGGTALYRHAV